MNPAPSHRLLVVGGDPVFARSLRARLVGEGYAVAEARDGREGMKAIVTLEPHLVISEWTMPHVDGLELCRAVKLGLGEAAPYFVLVTARDDAESCNLALESGADDLLVKPWHPGELSARVRNGVRHVALQARIRQLSEELERVRAGNGAGDGVWAPMPASVPLCRECGRMASPAEWKDLVGVLAGGGLARFDLTTCPGCVERGGEGDGRISRAA